LATLDQTQALTILLDLITVLAYNFPSLTRSLLSHPPSHAHGEDIPPRIIYFLCDVVRDRLTIGKDRAMVEQDADLDSLVKATIELLECLCWNVPSELQDRHVGNSLIANCADWLDSQTGHYTTESRFTS
jgi:hypothetical protein